MVWFMFGISDFFLLSACWWDGFTWFWVILLFLRFSGNMSIKAFCNIFSLTIEFRYFWSSAMCGFLEFGLPSVHFGNMRCYWHFLHNFMPLVSDIDCHWLLWCSIIFLCRVVSSFVEVWFIFWLKNRHWNGDMTNLITLYSVPLSFNRITTSC